MVSSLCLSMNPRKMASLWVTFSIFVVSLTVASSETSPPRRAYVAAAYEHARIGKRADPPKLVVEKNLELYQKAAEVAHSQGADIIVYPEYGIFFPGNRTQLKPFLEEAPDPKKIRTNPCEESEHYSQRYILHTLSCIAKNNSIVVVANTGDIQNCTGESDCPEDGVFHFNTNVVFDKDGTMLLKYHKEHLYYEVGMDLARKQQDPTFTTDFGTFATYICFDIIYGRMGEVAKWPNVDGVMFSTMWLDQTPQYVSVPLWQGWGMGYNTTIVVSNINIPGYFAVGSGIFHGLQGSLGYTYDPDYVSKLVVAKVPVAGQPAEPSNPRVTAITATKSWNWENCGADIQSVCSRALLNLTDDVREQYRCLDENTKNYTLVKLTNPSGYVEACNNGMCCSANYTTKNMSETFYLGVYNGTYTIAGRYIWSEENCFIARCDSNDGHPCSTFPRRSTTLFSHVELRSNFSTPHIYPSVVSSRVRLVPLDEWEYSVTQKSAYESSIHFHMEAGRRLINLGFKARCYDRDPPFIR